MRLGRGRLGRKASAQRPTRRPGARGLYQPEPEWRPFAFALRSVASALRWPLSVRVAVKLRRASQAKQHVRQRSFGHTLCRRDACRPTRQMSGLRTR